MAQIIFRTNKEIDFEEEIKIEGVGWKWAWNEEGEKHQATIVRDYGAWAWYTHTSKYYYILLPDLTPNTYYYRGALRGFLQQELLPDFGQVEIISVTGTYGNFHGKNALTVYKNIKALWSRDCEAVLTSAFKTAGIYCICYHHLKLMRELEADLKRMGVIPKVAHKLPTSILRKIWRESDLSPEVEIPNKKGPDHRRTHAYTY